jgi:hypothetical protein
MALFWDIETIDLFFHSYLPRPETGDVTSFAQGCASSAVMIRQRWQADKQFNAWNKYFFQGYIQVLHPTFTPQFRTDLYTFGDINATKNGSNDAGVIFAKNNIIGYCWGNSISPSSSSQMTFSRQANQSTFPRTQADFGPIQMLPPSWFYETNKASNAVNNILFEATYLGAPYAMIATNNTFANPDAWQLKLFNSALYPGAQASDPIVGTSNAATPVMPISAAIGNETGLPWNSTPGLGDYWAGNSPDYRYGWNYGLIAKSNTGNFVLAKWRMTDADHPLDCAWMRPVIFDTSFIQGMPTLDASYFNWQSVQSTTFGFYFPLTKAYTYKGKAYWGVFLQRDGQAFYLMDWNFHFISTDGRAGSTFSFTNNSVRNATVDSAGFWFVEMVDGGGPNIFVGCSRVPLFQNAMPDLINPSIIPTQGIGCFNPCNSFPTIPPGK